MIWLLHWPRGVSPTLFAVTDEAEQSPPSVKCGRRDRSNEQRATPRRWRICSVGTGAVRQFTITTGHVGTRRRRCPKSEPLLASRFEPGKCASGEQWQRSPQVLAAR